MRARVSEKATVSVVFTATVFMSALDTTIVNVALPTIGRDFAVAPTAVDGISVAYLVSLALFMPASGWLADRFGGKRILLTATVIFTVASALCGAATSLGELVAFRGLQGVGGGMMTPVGMAMLFRAFPPGERLRASAVLLVPTTLGPASGPVLGGLLVSELSWRWVFWVNIPIGVASVAFGASFLPHRAEKGPGRFDLPGFLLSGVGLGLLMYGVSEGPNVGWASPVIVSCIVAGAVLLAVTMLVEYRAADPIVAVRLLSDRLFRCGTAANILMTSGFIGTLFVMSLYLQDGRGLGALAAGLTIFPEAVGVAVGSQLASRVLYPWLGPRRHMAGGLAGIAAAIGLMALLGAHSSLWWARLLMFAMGSGMAQVMLSTQTASFATISPEATGRASTMFNAGRQLGAATGVALLTTAIGLVGATHHVSGHVVANPDAYRAAFLAAAAFCLAGMPFALLVRDTDAAATIPARGTPRRNVLRKGLLLLNMAGTGARRTVTMADIARAAGVSVTTVSHVVNRTRPVSPEKVRTVLAAIAEMGYVPDSVTRSLRSVGTQTIGLAMSAMSNPYFGEVVLAIERTAAKAGYSLLLADTHDEADEELRAISNLLSRRVEAIVLAPSAEPTAALKYAGQRDVPVVLIDRFNKADVDQIGVENIEATAGLVDHLAGLGHRRIGMISGKAGLGTTDERLAGFLLGLRRNKLRLDDRYELRGDSSVSGAEAAFHELLSLPELPTALVIGNNQMAIGAMRAARDAGVRVPDDLAVVVFDDFEWADLFHPRLTVIAQPTRTLGEQAVELVLSRLADPSMPARRMTLQAEFIHRESCGCKAPA